MIFLTGDVHHRSLNTRERPYIEPAGEIDLAVRYMEVAARHGLRITLFITGRTFLEDEAGVRRLLRFDNLEIGGHTFDAFKPRWLHGAFKVARKSYWRSRRHQEGDVERTVRTVEERCGLRLQSWRNHCYDWDRNTPGILAAHGIQTWSDELTDAPGPIRRGPEGLTILPVNVIPDHDRLIHGYRTREHLARESGLRRLKVVLGGSAPLPSHEGAEWFAMLARDVEEKLTAVGFATLNLHPVCMGLLDDFRTFERICALCSGRDSRFAREAPDCVADAGG